MFILTEHCWPFLHQELLKAASVSSQEGFQRLSWMSQNSLSPLSSIGKHTVYPLPTVNLFKTFHNSEISSQFAGREWEAQELLSAALNGGPNSDSIFGFAKPHPNLSWPYLGAPDFG